MRTILIASLGVQIVLSPFRSSFVNKIETLSLFVTILATSIQRPAVGTVSSLEADTVLFLLDVQLWLLAAGALVIGAAVAYVKRDTWMIWKKKRYGEL